MNLRVVQLNVGAIVDYPADDHGVAWRSSIAKHPVADRRRVATEGIGGDTQSDLVHHGGAHKAVLAYATAHYPAWHAEAPGLPWPLGAFGENLAIDGATEETVCIGDQWRGDDGLVFEVSQPRQPCWKLARRWRRKTLAAEVRTNGRTGWYLRVLRSGTVAAGSQLELAARPFPEWSVARATALMNAKDAPADALAQLASLPPLAHVWRESLQGRLGA